MKIPKAIKIIISLAIITALIVFVGPKKLLDTISDINLIYFIPIIIIYFLTFIIGTWNIGILLGGIKKKIKFTKLVKYTLISWSLGLISPGKIGDFSIIYFLKKDKIKLGVSLAITIIDKIITLLVLVLFAIITAIILLTQKELLIIIGLLILLIIISLVLLTERVRRIIRNKILGKYSKQFKGFYKTIHSIIKNNKKELFYNLLVTILKWLVSGVNMLLIFMALGSKGNLVLITLISASLIIFQLIPITFHGIGLKEGVGIYLYGLIGIPGEVVIASYIIFNILSYIFAGMAIYFAAEEVEKIKLK